MASPEKKRKTSSGVVGQFVGMWTGETQRAEAAEQQVKLLRAEVAALSEDAAQARKAADVLKHKVAALKMALGLAKAQTEQAKKETQVAREQARAWETYTKQVRTAGKKRIRALKKTLAEERRLAEGAY